MVVLSELTVVESIRYEDKPAPGIDRTPARTLRIDIAPPYKQFNNQRGRNGINCK